MKRLYARLVLPLAAALALQACIAAVVPVAAGAAIGRKTSRDRPARPVPPSAGGTLTVLPPGSTLPPPTPPASPPPPAVPPTMQYLYGSGEAAALSLQAWRAFVRHVADKALQRPKESVVLAPWATLANPVWEPCGRKPLAVILNVDETVVLNLGRAFRVAQVGALTEAQTAEWEREGGMQVVAVPGAVRAVDAVRTMDVAVVFVTDRDEGNAAATATMLAGIGLGEAKPDETLFSAEVGPLATRKDPRRAAIGSLYCVLAIAGSRLGDFTDLFDAAQGPAARRAETLSTPVNARFGAGWFLLPNTLAPAALRGGVDDVFPQDMRWTPRP